MNKKQLTNSKFGKGWSIIAFSFLLYFFWIGTTIDGLNVYPSTFADMNGWDFTTLLSYATPAGILGVVGGIIGGRIVIKLGPRKLSGIALIVAGACYIIFGRSVTPVMYLVFILAFTFIANMYGMIANTTVMSNWFPRKKGIALGWSTMGAPCSSAFFVPLLSVLTHKLGIGNATTIIGSAVIVFGIIALILVKDYPEQAGAYPDNIAAGQDELKHNLALMSNYKSPFTIGKLLKDKDMWLISLGFGSMWMVTVGIMSQFINRMMSVGFNLNTALTMLTIASIIGFGGSYFWGWLDQKTSTKAASLIYSVSYIIALLLLILASSSALVYIAIIFVGLGIGGLLNLMPSMAIQVYGRYDFPAANGLIAPISTLCMEFTFLIMARLLVISGGNYTLPYIVFIGIDIVGAILLMFVTKTCKGKTDDTIIQNVGSASI